MKFKFIGTYNGAETINAGGVVFTGREPAEVEDIALIARLTSHVEFEEVDADTPEEVEDDMAELRAAYKEKMGKRPFPGWDADTLRDKMNG